MPKPSQLSRLRSWWRSARQQRPVAGPGAVDRALQPDAGLGVVQQLPGPLGQRQIDLGAGPVPVEQPALPHPGQRRACRVLADARTGDRLDEAAGEQGGGPVQQEVRAKGQQHGLRADRGASQLAVDIEWLGWHGLSLITAAAGARRPARPAASAQ
jgi:hypothetical protein